jgi:hypothetical protein
MSIHFLCAKCAEKFNVVESLGLGCAGNRKCDCCGRTVDTNAEQYDFARISTDEFSRVKAKTPKPCPFCGHMPDYCGNGQGTFYACVNGDCASSGSWSFNGDDAQERALKLWNERAGEQE